MLTKPAVRRVSRITRFAPVIGRLIGVPGACRIWVIVASMVGERAQRFTISRRIVVLCNEISGNYGPLSRLRSRSILDPTGSWGIIYRRPPDFLPVGAPRGCNHINNPGFSIDIVFTAGTHDCREAGARVMQGAITERTQRNSLMKTIGSSVELVGRIAKT